MITTQAVPAIAPMCAEVSDNATLPSKFVPQNSEDSCAVNNALQRVCSGAAAEGNDVFDGD